MTPEVKKEVTFVGGPVHGQTYMAMTSVIGHCIVIPYHDGQYVCDGEGKAVWEEEA